MTKKVKLMTPLLCLGLVAGCSIDGSWKTTKVTPANYTDKFAFSTVDFGKDGMYTATVNYGGRETTTHGKYKWDPMRMKLTVMPREGDSREYKGQIMWGKTLKLQHKHEGEKITGEMKKQS